MTLRSFLHAWNEAPGNVRGALLVLLAAVFFSCMGVLVKTLGERLDSFQIAFFRCLFGLVAVLPFLAQGTVRQLRTSHLSSHVLRAFLGVGAMTCGFYAVTHMPLADAVAISFTKPMFVIVLAIIVLREPVPMRRGLATVIGFFGVLIIVGPGGDGVQLIALVALAGSMMVAGVQIVVKRLSATESTAAILFYFGVVTTLVALGPALFVWQTPTWREFGLLVMLGAFGSLGQALTVHGLRVGDASAVSPFDYARLLFSAILGYIVFSEVPGPWSYVGALLIVGSALYIARREAIAARTALEGR